MRKNTIVMVGIAVVFGLLAVFVAQGWLAYQAELGRKTTEPKSTSRNAKASPVRPIRMRWALLPDW